MNEAAAQTAGPIVGAGYQLLVELIRNSPLSRTELAERLGLSLPSITRLCGPLLVRGLIREGQGAVAQGRGRPRRPLALQPEALHLAGVNITGSDATGVIVNLRG